MKIKKISFGDVPFRMFKNIEIEIADRITVIAGHNGIGKSTLLGLIANGSELKKSSGTTIFHKAFQAQLHELFFLDRDKDYFPRRKNKPSFCLTYVCEGKTNLVKTCNVSEHREKNGTNVSHRLKVVPRGVNPEWPDVGPSAKVTIPTLFLSMSRMLPIGEQQESFNIELLKRLSDDDRLYIKEKFKSIIDNKVIESSNITKHEFKGTTKKSLLPEFEHSTRVISLGQDSLSSIITAFASFNKLKREQGELYNGGILLIDEIDAGFHPRAQIKLIKLIKEEAKSLKLQVIMTSHSLTIIKQVLNISDDTARVGRNIDSVVYIEDVFRPKLMSHPAYQNIKNDMLGILPPINEEIPKIKVYFEDAESMWFFDELIKYEEFDVKSLYGHEFLLVAAKLGCDNLKSLYKADNYYRSVIIVFDNDVICKLETKKMIDENKNLLALPILPIEDITPDMRTPESQIYCYLDILLKDHSHNFWNCLPDRYNITTIKDIIYDSFPLKQTDKPLRELRKNWLIEHQSHFEKLKLIKFFCKDNQNEIIPFFNDLKTAIDSLK